MGFVHFGGNNISSYFYLHYANFRFCSLLLSLRQSGDTELSGIPLDLGEPNFFKPYFDNEDLNLQGYNFSFSFSAI